MNDPIATPVLTVPNDLTYTSGPYDDSRNEDRTSLGNGEGDEDRAAGEGYAIYLTEDWESGIGTAHASRNRAWPHGSRESIARTHKKKRK